MAPVPDAGLCADCHHARRTENRRGSVFLLCELALSDANYRKYPPLPVTECPGHTPEEKSKPPRPGRHD